MKQKFVLLSVILLSVGSLLFPSFAFSENFTASESNSTEIVIPEVNTSKDLKEDSSTNEKSIFAQIPSGLSKYEKFEKLKEKFEKLKEKDDKDKKLRVIISLDAGFTPEGKLDFAKVKEQKNKIRQYQESILGELDSYNATQIHEFKHVPFMAMVVDKNALERLEADPMVASITEDVLHHPTLAQSVPLIGAPAAWASGYSGQGQAVAILDSGVEKGHSAFAGGRVISEACYSTTFPADNATSVCPGGVAESTATNSALPCTVSGCDHGTHVAGIAAGNDTTILGVAPDADIVAIQVFSKLEPNVGFCGSTQPCIGAYTTDIIKGLEHVLFLSSSTDISSVNLSLGFGAWSDEDDCDDDNPGLTTAADNLKSAGIATVASSGNNFSPTTIGSPACITSVVSVGSTTDTTDIISSFSNSAIFLDLLAPGQVITSSVPTGYGNKQGTSMASPHVAGAFAVLNSFDPAISVDNALSALENTGVPILDSRNGFTFPRIQVDSAVNSLIPKTVISFEDFEGGFNTWTNTSGDDNDCWLRDSSGTPTTNTGPSTGAATTTWYVYYESSCGADLDEAFLLGPAIDFNAFNSVQVQFSRHMWDGGAWNGNDMGKLSLEIEDSPGSGIFTEVWSQQGNQGNQWDQFTVDLSGPSYDNTGQRQFRFVATDIATGAQSDMAVDEITIEGVAISPPQSLITISSENFEIGFTTWTNTSGDDNDCWLRDSSGTPTTNTGPSTGAATTTWYVYYESSCGADLDEAFLLGPAIDFNAFNSVQVQFSRHMWDGGAWNGNDMGKLSLEIEDSPGSGIFTEVWSQQGNQGNQWDQFTVDLSSEDNTGQRQLRFVATDIAVGAQSDMAVDEITLEGDVVPTTISSENFEIGFTTWTNTSGDDNDCWLRDSSGTPTTNTGPSTGAATTTWYVYYESSCGADLDEAFLLGPAIDFNAFNSVQVQFSRHMWDGGAWNGNDMGKLSLEIEDSPGSGIFTEVWSQQGNQGNQWDQFTVDLSGPSYDNTGQRQFRFVATDIATGAQSDMAVDEITIEGDSV